MMIDILKYLNDYNIPYFTEGKNVTQGWVNIQCPLCEDHSNHGGFNLSRGYYSCWLCGWHPIEEIVSHLEGISIFDAKKLLSKYREITPLKNPLRPLKSPRGDILRGNPMETLGVNFHTLSEHSKKYLKIRKFNPKELEEKFGLVETGNLGSYKFRIIAPIIYKNRVVSFQGRDYTGQAKLKYKTCPKDFEIIHHKHILYNSDKIKNNILIVEGITDVWRLGDGAVATFGISYTKEQVKEIINLQKKYESKIFVLFDSDLNTNAQEKAKLLCKELASFGIKVKNITLESDDPANLSQEEAEQLKKEIKL